MGTVIAFPEVWRDAPATARNDGQAQPATVVILPVIRIERHDENPPSNAEPGPSSRGKSRRSPTQS